MRILNTKQIRELDAYTIQHEPVSSIDLMERAARAFVDWFVLRVEVAKPIGVVCGTGNNGGDGLAIARMLAEWSYPVRVWIVRGGSATEDFRLNEARLVDSIERMELKTEEDEICFEGCAILIDALFGSGLSRPPAGLFARVIARVNEAPALRIAVDMPSGLMADAPAAEPIVRANYTVTFQLPKLAFLLPFAHAFTGEWAVVDIGLDKKFIREATTPYFFTRSKDVRRLLKTRKKNDHKGTFGHALVIAGSHGKMGAAVLATRGALRAGVGLLTVHVPECGYAIMQTAVPEAMAQVDDAAEIFSMVHDERPYDTAGIGPGLGQDARTVKGLASFLERFRKPVVLDADALNILGANRHLLELVPAGSILTPHPKEFERLAGKWENDFERLEIQKDLAVSLKSVVVLKGAHTSIATEKGEVWFNSTGNPGMATGGTGDVLTGILTGLLAQNYSPVEAAVAGVYLHGLAGDLAVTEYGMDSLIASDLITFLPGAFLKVFRK